MSYGSNLYSFRRNMEVARSTNISLNSYQTTRSHLRHNFKSAIVTRRYSTAATWKQVALLGRFEILTSVSMDIRFYFCVSLHRSISQIKHQLDATLCKFYFCRVTLHVSGVKRPSSGVLKNWHGGPWYRCYSCR